MKRLIKENRALKNYLLNYDYTDQALIVSSATSGGVLSIFFTSIVGAPVRTASASLTFFFLLQQD